jgi:hypothetical protein
MHCCPAPNKRKKKENGMKTKILVAVLTLAAISIVSAINLLLADDQYSLKEPNGISFSEIRGFESWPTVAPSYRTDQKEVRTIVANDTMIRAYKSGIPGNGKPFPDGSIIVKIGWSERPNPKFPPAMEPDVLKRVEFIIKDSARFPNTSGWGYARFVYDARTSTFTPYGKDASFGMECYGCHTLVREKDFIFTNYALR